MTRYVKHKHGLTLGSGNIFFVIDRPSEDQEPPIILPEGVSDFRDGYRAIVAFEPIVVDSFNYVNCDLKSSAQQLVWNSEVISWDYSDTYTQNGLTKTISYEKIKRFSTLKPWWEGWFDREVGLKYRDWDTYSRSNRSDGCVFFKKRKDAVNFVRTVKSFLKGERLGFH